MRTEALRLKTPDGVPYDGIADVMAHFCVLEDYNTAKDLGLLTPEDIKRMDIFDLSTGAFEQGKAFRKGDDGRYSWVLEPEVKKQAWFVGASVLYRAFSKN